MTGLLATYVEQKSNHESEKTKPKHQTLEDVAEDFLDGILCHYEPPRTKKKRRGILRRPKMFRREGGSSVKSVRWMDSIEQNATTPADEEQEEPGCGIAPACLDAGIEAGCVPEGKEESCKEFLAKYDYKVREGWKKDDNEKDLPPPPPPPHPKKKGRYLPKCCGVQISCGDNEDQLETVLSQDSKKGEVPSKPYNRPRQKYEDADDDSNSIVEIDVSSSSDSDEDKEKKRSQKQRTRRPSVRQIMEEYANSGSEPDWETTSNTSSAFLQRVMKPFHRGQSKNVEIETSESDVGGIEDRGRARRRTRSRSRSRSPGERRRKSRSLSPARTRSRSPARRKAAAKMDPVEKVRSKINQPSKNTAMRIREEKSRQAASAGDWDDGIPIVPELPLSSSTPRVPAALPGALRSQEQTKPTMYPQIHPAHPLNQVANHRDDLVERQSFITAHRQGFGSTTGNDDMIERQSFITAHRFEPTHARINLGPIQENQQYASQQAHYNAMERQSYIMANRQAMDMAHHQVPYGRPISPSRGRAEIRQKSPRRGRSHSPRRANSPYRRSRSFEQEFRTDIPRGDVVQRRTSMDGYYNYGHPAMPVQDGLVSQDRRMNGPRAVGQSNVYYGGPLQPSVPLQGMYYDPHLRGQANVYYNNSVLPGQHMGPIVQGQPVDNEATKPEEKSDGEMTWEERTRQAWERIRGGVVSSFNLDSSTKQEEQNENTAQVNNPSTPPPQAVRMVQSPSFPRDQPLPQQQQMPVGILRNPQEKRVSFGQPQERIFYDDQDENRSTMTYPAPGGKRTKKKKVFRGTKLISGVFGKAKHSVGKIGLSRSRSQELHGSGSRSQEWEDEQSFYASQPQGIPLNSSSLSVPSYDYDASAQYSAPPQQGYYYAGYDVAGPGNATGYVHYPQRASPGGLSEIHNHPDPRLSL